MTVKELIEELMTVEDQNALVVMQYRDGGGDYKGYDSDIRMDYKKKATESINMLGKDGYWRDEYNYKGSILIL